MPDPGDRQRHVHSRRKRAVARYACAALLAAFAWFAVTASLARVIVRSNAATAYRFAPYDAQIGARLARSLIDANASSEDRLRSHRLAHDALRSDATAVAAVTALGISAEIRGDHATASRWFGYGLKLSRRDLSTQLWAIEDAVARQDVAGALRHYDMSLKTSPESADLLFPVLAIAAQDDAIRPQLIRLLAGRPFWSDPFIDYMASKGPAPLVTATLLLGLHGAGVPVPETARAATLATLTQAGYADAAWRYYQAYHPKADRRKSRDPNFTAMLTAPSPLDWMPVDTPGISVSIQREGTQGYFEFSVPPGVGGAVLRQLQMLPAGTYRLSALASGIEQPLGQRPYWSLTCHDGREFGRAELVSTPPAKTRFAGDMVVPSGCGIQMLQLIVRPVDAAAGLSGRIEYVKLEPR